MPTALSGLRSVAGEAMAVCATMGDSGVVSLCTPPGPLCRAWSGSGAYSVERREASADDSDDGLSGTLGTASDGSSFLARVQFSG